MIYQALDEAASRGELILVQDGLLRYHLRKDGANLECFRRSMAEIAALWRRHRDVRNA